MWIESQCTNGLAGDQQFGDLVTVLAPYFGRVGVCFLAPVEGLIYFPNQAFVYKPKQYSAVFFPGAGSEYIHGITTVTRGDRFTALFMHTSDPTHVDPDYHPGENKYRALEFPLVRQ